MNVGMGRMPYTIAGRTYIISSDCERDPRDREAASATGDVSAQAPDRLVPVDAGLGHAVGGAAEGQHVPQLGGQPALLGSNDGGHDHVQTVDLLQHRPRHTGHLTHVVP